MINEAFEDVYQPLSFKGKLASFLAALLIFTMGMGVLQPLLASAATAPGQNVAKVSFTFDDGLASATLAQQTLSAYGYTATDYIITNCVGMTTAPNTCAADPAKSYMTWDQIAALKANGWEIGSHTQSHPLTAAADNPSLTDTQLDAEMSTSQLLLQAKGYAATAFASPYGDYDNRSLAVISKYYSSHRAFQDYVQPTAAQDTVTNTFPYFSPRNVYPYNNALIPVEEVQGNISVATVEKYVDTAITNKQWLVLVFHEIKASGASTAEADYQYNATDLATIAAYIKSKSVPVVNMTDALASGADLMPNSGFNNGIADGWTTDDVAGIVADKQTSAPAGHGSYDGTATGPLNSIAIKSVTVQSHLFSPQIAVTAGTTYTLTNFVNVSSTVGGVNYFVDSYDAAGTYLSSQKVNAVIASTTANAVQVGYVNFMYTPAAGVAKVRVYADIAPGTIGYLDNMRFLSPDGATVPVTPPATSTGDINGDGKIDALDLSTLLSNWNKTAATTAQGDLNGDTKVDALDLSTLLANWSK